MLLKPTGISASWINNLNHCQIPSELAALYSDFSIHWNTAELARPLGRGVNFQIEVDDIEQIFARVKAHGVTLYRDLRDNHYSTGEKTACQREFLVLDPDGYLLRFSQYIE